MTITKLLKLIVAFFSESNMTSERTVKTMTMRELWNIP